MKRWFPSTLVTTAALTAALAGCQAKPKPVPPPPPQPPMTVPEQRAADAAEFRATLARFDGHLADLPGHTESDHRAAAAAVLADLTDALRLAYGTRPPPGFMNDVAIVDAAAKTAALPDVPHDRLAAAENEALHAATAALSEVAMRVLFDDPGLPPAIDAATAKADGARASQGPLHDGDATDALAALGTALHRVDGDLQERFANAVTLADPTPSRAAATMPTPATTPATMPTTMTTR